VICSKLHDMAGEARAVAAATMVEHTAQKSEKYKDSPFPTPEMTPPDTRTTRIVAVLQAVHEMARHGKRVC
jgi:hypothetical protein